MLGMGTLGQACAKALTGLGFGVLGWSRSGGNAAYSGQEGLADVLGRADFIVTLLPKTAETENLIGREALSWAKRGAVLLNPGRGALIDDDALLEALNTGQIAHATLDVFRTEPLPQDHPFWAHPRITVTPHIAAETRPEGAVRALAENIRRSQNGDALLYQVDRARGY
jgi:glyoxylate/hydroxypyruvate reductase A